MVDVKFMQGVQVKERAQIVHTKIKFSLKHTPLMHIGSNDDFLYSQIDLLLVKNHA